ncbi:hypothetical protein E6P09_13510 [Haloferax mediterranei ATCC 33500]|uniref:Uncharacterized protein n=1 Tax=Haloferax mediterranei (strain ATCC 33500 / DSM 1411 / JCM 8866 / NBRC 14739 / NCIMB 2177 / R-4) TaxID=523841 RepID=A0A4P8P631_HALMT|nr:hypothetical protein [Haloferax mediterranei]MDX5986914.1 hypothetical protein [Haloferax mediterranei ATCC 33500]QCQ76236.1 hypothetical protein E6P09_13510 [Haloferax mediterranei ATCC 33500]
MSVQSTYEHFKRQISISGWWLLILVPGALHLVGQIFYQLAKVSNEAGSATTIPLAGITILFTLSAGILSLAMPVALFFDTKKIRQSAVGWNPYPLYWGGIGVVFVVILVLTRQMFAFYLAAMYLPIRYWMIRKTSTDKELINTEET